MNLASIHTRAQLGVDAPAVRVEVHLAGGLPSFNIVGLPETAVRESRDRVRAAITNSGFDQPTRRITAVSSRPVSSRPLRSTTTSFLANCHSAVNCAPCPVACRPSCMHVQRNAVWY